MVILNQIGVFTAMVMVMQFEWITGIFMSWLYLMFPAIETLFMLNRGLQLNLMSSENIWAVWFGIILQVSALFINSELLIGGFAEFFGIPLDFWS